MGLLIDAFFHACPPFAMQTPRSFKPLYNVAAHDAEVFSLAYAPTSFGDPSMESFYLLASGSRDKLIHVLAGSRSSSKPRGPPLPAAFELLETQEYHRGAVTALRFSMDGKRLFSCGSDRLLTMSRMLLPTGGADVGQGGAAGGEDVLPRAHLYRSIPLTHGPVYDMAVDATGKYLVTAGGEDRKVHIYSSSSGKHMRSYAADPSGTVSDTGELYKIAVCPAGMCVGLVQSRGCV